VLELCSLYFSMGCIVAGDVFHREIAPFSSAMKSASQPLCSPHLPGFFATR
jgi:hypothetical protein